MKICPFCAEDIKAAAIKCRYCHSMLEGGLAQPSEGMQAQPAPASDSDQANSTTRSAAEAPHKESSAQRRRRAMAAADIHESPQDEKPPWSNAPRQPAQESKAARREREDAERARRAPHLAPVDYEVTVTKFSADDSLWRRNTRATVKGDLYNRSSQRCSFELTFEFLANTGTVLETGSLALRDVQPWSSTQWTFDYTFTDLSKLWGTLAKRVSVSTKVTATHVDMDEKAKRDAQPKPGVPLLEWRGFAFITRKPSVAAACLSCSYEWRLESTVANEIAQEQGLGGRLKRRGTAMEQFGATFTPMASGRRIAAGNELQRHEDTLVSLYRMAACPHCGSIKVLLGKD